MFFKIASNIHKKTPLFNKVVDLGLQVFENEIPTQMFSCQIFKNIIF